MDFKKWIDTRPIWLKYGVLVSASYSAVLIFLYVTTFVPLPNFLNFFFDRLHEIFYFPQIYLSSKILISTSLYWGYRSWNIMFYFMQLIFTIIIGFVIGAIIGNLRKK